MRFIYIFTLIITSLMIGCQSKEEQWRNPDVCDFINEDKRIKVNYELDYDIIPRPTLGTVFQNRSDVGVEMEIFNYRKKTIVINKYYIDNIYLPNLAPISHFYIVGAENISITNTFNDETYGEWAKGRVVVTEFNRLFENVFISPLAYNYIQKKQYDDNDCLVLVRLISLDNNCTFNGIFYGDYLTEWIINSNYKQIMIKHPMLIVTNNNCGAFWSPLLTDEEYKIYESFLQMRQMGLVPNQQKLPRTIIEKITR